jgi:mannose-6-phosphate isomerase-like protein (cupin superfamily)
MSMLKYKVDFDNLRWEHPMEGVQCKIYKYGNKQLRLVEYTKDMPLHWCEKGHYGYILDGKFEIEYQNETVIYQTGDGVFIPEGKEHKHKAKVLSDSVKVLFVENV